MAEENRIFANYGGQTLAAVNFDTGALERLAAVPVRLFINQGRIAPTVEVWRSVEAFEARQPSLGNKFNRTFSLNEEESAQAFAAYDLLFDPMTANALEWLGASAADYDLEMLDVNLTNLQVRARAEHKQTGATIERKTRNLAEFEAVKTDYPDLVMNYFYFTWGFAKQKSPVFAAFS